jgi:hypothetical protein
MTLPWKLKLKAVQNKFNEYIYIYIKLDILISYLTNTFYPMVIKHIQIKIKCNECS